MYQGRKYEERSTRVYVLHWKSLAFSHQFFTSASYDTFNTLIQPALKGREVSWTNHAVVNASPLSSPEHLQSILRSHAIEVAWTKVVEGKVAGYFEQFDKVVRPILNDEPGCDGFFISPNLETPQKLMLLINWQSVDVCNSFSNSLSALAAFFPVFIFILFYFLEPATDSTSEQWRP
jgi:heme-degrading monooxygenase HmoA